MQNPNTPASRAFGREVSAVRTARQWRQVDLAERLTAFGVPTSQVAVSRVESGGQGGISIDDVMAYALALGVSPIRLLMPREGDDEVQITPTVTLDGRSARTWMRGQAPLIWTCDSDDPTQWWGRVHADMPATELRLVIHKVHDVVTEASGLLEEVDEASGKGLEQALAALAGLLDKIDRAEEPDIKRVSVFLAGRQ